MQRMTTQLRALCSSTGCLVLGLFGSLVFSPVGNSLSAGQYISPPTLLSSTNQGLANAPQTANVYTVSPNVLAIEVAAPTMERGKQMPYTPQADDVLVTTESPTQVKRAGQVIGILVGDKQDILYTYDQVEDKDFPRRRADNTGSYEISSTQDANYATATEPLEVFRKTKPVAFAQQSDRISWPATHTLYLTLPKSLVAGSSYRLSFPGLGIPETTFDYQPSSTRSEAVQISQLGFRPDDPLKVGYLSTWMGNGGGLDYPDNLSFELIDQQTEQSVYSGSAQQVHEPGRPEDPRGRDYTLNEVHRFDFSDFSQPGEYRLCVEGIGCSFDFEIASDVWDKAFFTSARGFYHQRSGIAIGEPHSSFSRPRAFHPEDGAKVYHSDATLQEVDEGIGSLETFETLNSKVTDTLVPEAWGGYFDAGDWDRRIQHLSVPRSLLELHNLFPDHFKAVDLNIPESGNALPDILDEALWSIDSFRRMQTAEGGIRGGIQSESEGVAPGEGSWQESLKVMAFAPDVWSSYVYAGVAARAAFTLQSYDTTLANTYRESALKAMAYAETHYEEKDYPEEGPQHHIKDQRNLAALELYRLTGETQWHDIFLATTVFTDASVEPAIYDFHEQRDAAFLYARLNQPQSKEKNTTEKNTTAAKDTATQNNAKNKANALAVDAQVQANARASFLRYADTLVAQTQTTAFGWGKQHPEAPVGWGNGLGAPKGMNILRAHALTQEAKYLQAGLSSTQFPGGANPANMVFTTGMGDRSPQNPLIVDQRVTGQAPPPGITLYGPSDLSVYENYWTITEIASSTFPDPHDWPTTENYFDIYLYPMGSEFTVDYMVTPTYTWGYLAARGN